MEINYDDFISKTKILYSKNTNIKDVISEYLQNKDNDDEDLNISYDYKDKFFISNKEIFFDNITQKYFYEYKPKRGECGDIITNMGFITQIPNIEYAFYISNNLCRLDDKFLFVSSQFERLTIHIYFDKKPSENEPFWFCSRNFILQNKDRNLFACNKIITKYGFYENGFYTCTFFPSLGEENYLKNDTFLLDATPLM